MNSMWTVMSFTMRNKVRNKAFVITTIVIAILMVVGANVPTFLDKFASGGGAKKIGYVVNEQGVPEGSIGDIIKGLEKYYGDQEKPKVQLVPVSAAGSAAEQTAALKQAIADKTIKGYLLFKDNPSAGFPNVTYYSKKMLDTDMSQALQNGLQTVKTQQAVQDAKLSQAQLAKLFDPVNVDSVQISDNANGKTADEQGTAIGLTYVILILLFMSTMITGQLIATEITSEKSSRVMEIIVTSVSPLKQLFGKVLGTFLVGLIQLVVIVGAAVVNLLLPQNQDAFKSLGIRLDTIEPNMIVFAVIFYLIGFFLYAMLFAAVGSIVSRTEDLGQAVMPITLVTLAGFYIAIFSMTHPGSSLVSVCSFIPFFSPFIMFMRIGLANPAWWEVGLSIAILAATVLLLGWLSAKIYRTGVLMYGKRPTIKELINAMKAYNV